MTPPIPRSPRPTRNLLTNADPNLIARSSASAATIPGSIIPQYFALCELKSAQIGPTPQFQQRRWRASVGRPVPRFRRGARRWRQWLWRSWRSRWWRRTREAVNYQQMQVDLEHASPLEIMDRALEMFEDDIAIAFREWYSWHFLELVKIINDNYIFAKVEKLVQNKSDLTDKNIPELAELIGDKEKAMEVVDASKSYMAICSESYGPA